MKVKTLIDYLCDFDQESEVILFDVSGTYDTYFLTIVEDGRQTKINIKNIFKIDNGGKTEVLH
jgi:hypothetical protein